MTVIIFIIAILLVVLLSLVLAFRPSGDRETFDRPGDLREIVKAHSNNSNSFLTLYQGFEYFRSRKSGTAVVAFVDTARAWVAATEPLADSADWGRVLSGFSRSARALGKSAMFLPMNKENAERAKIFGYGDIMIGSEPVFEFDRYEPRLDIVPTAKVLHARGAQVVDFRPDTITQDLKSQCDNIVAVWLSTRKIDPLSFLNRVAPWELAEDKRFFYVHMNGEVLAFAALIPIWNRNGWYLIDLMRKPTSPPGATELLVLESMRLLKKEGFKEFTLGVAPLSNLNLANKEGHRLTYFILNLVFERTTLFYRFKPLYQFKMKFKPTRIDPAYLVFSPARINVVQTLSLLEAFFPGGIFNATWSFVRRFMGRIYLWDWIERQLSPQVVTQPSPLSRNELFSRLSVTFTLFFLNLLFFPFTRGFSGDIDPNILNTWGFCWDALPSQEVARVLVSPFLHLNPWHLGANLILLFTFTGLLEIMGGSLFAFISYSASMLLTNPLTVITLWLPLHWIEPNWAKHLVADTDVGASLGIYGCAGSLLLMLKHRKRTLALLVLSAIVIAIATHTPLALNHGIAVVIGLVIGIWYLGR